MKTTFSGWRFLWKSHDLRRKLLITLGLLALYRRCTHLNCTVLWDETAGRFSCPCHGSEFEMDGDVLNPPAPDPLTRFPITVENGTVSVDTGNPIGRSATHPEDIFYPPGETP